MHRNCVNHRSYIVNACILALLFLLHLSIAAAETIDLSGTWSLRLDPNGQGTVSDAIPAPYTDSIVLPGTVSQAEKGNPLDLQPVLPQFTHGDFTPKKGLKFGRDDSVLTNSPLAHLYQRFSYIGSAWYRREVKIPASWTNQDVQLVLERVLWQSRVWVNGQPVGERNSLTTPHRYEISGALRPGRNEIVICVDNRRQLQIGNPHAYTEESQTIWNGIIGKIALETREKVRVERVELRPDLERQGIEVTVEMHNGSARELSAELDLRATADNFKGAPVPELKSNVTLAPGDITWKTFYPMGTNFERWSEFNPKLYKMQVSLTAGGSRFRAASSFGMREFKAEGNGFTINGQPVFLRGTVNCCEFPKTGYPDMTGRQWRKIFSTAKAYGLNHMRFHTWCPPEIAFKLADEYGIYLEVELPDWSFKIGQDRAVTEFFRQEGERMIHEYSHHPSWVMLTMGNELKGDYSVLDDLETGFRKLDPQLLYDSTTYPSSSRGKVPGPVDDYYISQDTRLGRARGQDIFNETTPNTETNFAPVISCIHVPFISHEVGQYCVYPNLAEIPKYDGVLRAVGFEAIRSDLKKKGRLDEAAAYTRDSGKLAALLYKEEIERALRTPNQAGFQLLELNDFPGQGTSTVGLLDAFWDGKGLITSDEFRQFCGPVVPLLLMPKRVYRNDEVFDAGVEIANFGPAPMTNQTIVWEIYDGRKMIGSGTIAAPLIAAGHGEELGRVRQPLSVETKAAELKVTVEVAGTKIKNHWSVWVYPAGGPETQPDNVAVFQTASESFYQALREGKRVLLLPSRGDVASPLAAEFPPVFWNPVMFPNQPGSMGAMIDARQPVFDEFPTDPWTNWQWWELVNHSFALDLDDLGAKVAMPFRFVDRFDRNALPAAIFEARVGAGRLLVCTLDISNNLDERVAAKQLRRSILDYMAGKRFRPQTQLTPRGLAKLFQRP